MYEAAVKGRTGKRARLRTEEDFFKSQMNDSENWMMWEAKWLIERRIVSQEVYLSE